MSLIEPKVEQILDQHRPHFLVADSMFHWATDVAAKFGIPRLIFNGTGFFALCASMSVMEDQPQLKVTSDSESFVIPNLPHEITTTRNEMPFFRKADGKTELIKLVKPSREAEKRSYGVIVNSFYELEPDYADHYRKVLGMKSWHISPVSLCNKVEKDKAEMGRGGSVDGVHEFLNWLNSKTPNSVVYICFGSLTNFSDRQLLKIALALEASHQHFIWVVKKKDKEMWLPEEFEQRMEVTWEKWATVEDDNVKSEASVNRDAIEKVVTEIMTGAEVEGMRSRAQVLGKMARKAVVKGGSSFSDLTALVEELRSFRS
ncbi:hypothetical protein ACLB2K_012828 [Fragaria x ananassa]